MINIKTFLEARALRTVKLRAHFKDLHGLSPAYLFADLQSIKDLLLRQTTMAMVVGHVSRPYVEPVHCRRPHFPDCRCTSLEHCRQTFGHL